MGLDTLDIGISHNGISILIGVLSKTCAFIKVFTQRNTADIKIDLIIIIGVDLLDTFYFKT